MKASIVVPLFNRLDLTRALLQSLPESLPAGLDCEVILVDDGSADGTREWLAALQDEVRIVLNERNLGFGASINRGASLARGELLVLLNNDVVLRPGWLEPMIAAHEGLGGRAGLIGNVQVNAATGLVDHAGIEISHKGKPDHVRRLPSRRVRQASPVQPFPAVTGACVLLSFELWRLLGGFDPRYVNGCEDVDLCLRARAIGRTNAVALQSVVGHHVSSSPGRKRRDEENTYRLTLAWREELARLGWHNWVLERTRHCWNEPRDFADPSEALWLTLYSLGLVRKPPPHAIAGIRAAIQVELDRWHGMFSAGGPP